MAAGSRHVTLVPTLRNALRTSTGARTSRPEISIIKSKQIITPIFAQDITLASARVRSPSSLTQLEETHPGALAES